MIAHGLSHWVCLFVVGFACLVFVNASSFPSLSSEALESLSENRFSTPCGISPTVIMKKKEEKGIRKKDKSKDKLSRMRKSKIDSRGSERKIPQRGFQVE